MPSSQFPLLADQILLAVTWLTGSLCTYRRKLTSVLPSDFIEITVPISFAEKKSLAYMPVGVGSEKTFVGVPLIHFAFCALFRAYFD